MRNMISILRRDLGAYYTSPIGYIFMMVFVTLSVGLYITSFFMFPMADMRPYFDNLPLLLCVFIPAVTMRIWAEERKENTWEMLLTFPMKGWELVVGKFLAALVFYMLTLAATCTVPAMLFSLGKPDPGAVIGGYFGTLLMGSFFLALGILFSGFFKDQIVAFVVTLLTCLAFFLVGTDFMSSYLDGRISGLGSVMADLLGVFTHYGGFTRGVIDVADTAFFLVWIAVFLALNVLFIDGRSRPGARTIFSVAAVMCIAIGMLFNYVVAGTSIARADLTQNSVYTVSKASKDIISNIDSEVQVKLYITAKDKMPTQMRNLERDITDKLRDLKAASGGKLNFDTVYLDAANVRYTEPKSKEKEKKTEAETVEQRMLDKGVEPFAARAMSEDEMTSKLVYSSIGVAYKDKPEEIIPQVIADEMGASGPSAATVPVSQLEYRLVNTIFKMTRPKKAVVALVAPKDRIDPQMRQMLMQMGQRVPEAEDPYESVQQILEYEKYDVKRVDLSKESPMPDDCDTLVVINPTSLNERQLWEINRALYSGKSVVLAVQTYEWNYEVTRDGIRMQREDIQAGKGNPMMGQGPDKGPKLNDLLKDYGVTVSDAVLMDKNSVTLTVPGRGQGLQAMLGQPVSSPTHVLVTNSSMAQDSPITNRLSGILYLWGTALDIDKAKLDQSGLKSEVLMSSSPQSWTIGAKEPMSEASFKTPESGAKSYPLMALVTGQFPDAYKDKPRPAYPKAQPQQPGMPPEPDTPDSEPAAKPAEAKPGKLVVLGCAEMFRKNFMQAGGGASSLDLFLNTVDGVTLDDRLVDVRGRKPIDRMIVKPDDRSKTVWRLVNYGLANVLIAGVGVAFFALRRRSRNAYTMAQSRAN